MRILGTMVEHYTHFDVPYSCDYVHVHASCTNVHTIYVHALSTKAAERCSYLDTKYRSINVSTYTDWIILHKLASRIKSVSIKNFRFKTISNLNRKFRHSEFTDVSSIIKYTFVITKINNLLRQPGYLHLCKNLIKKYVDNFYSRIYWYQKIITFLRINFDEFSMAYNDSLGAFLFFISVV